MNVAKAVCIPREEFMDFLGALENLLLTARERGDRYGVGYIGLMVENAKRWALEPVLIPDEVATAIPLGNALHGLADDLEFIFDGQGDYCAETGPNDAMRANQVAERLRNIASRISPVYQGASQ